MKKILLIAAVVVGAVSARAGVHVDIGIGFPAWRPPVVVAPPPVVVAPAPPVYVAPPPMYAPPVHCAPPVVYAPPPVIYPRPYYPRPGGGIYLGFGSRYHSHGHGHYRGHGGGHWR